MKLILLIILLLTNACTTFSFNQSSLVKACKSGIQEYDDGNMSFKCFDKKSVEKEKKP